MTECRSGVYEIRNTINGHRYIGSSVSVPNRLCRHKNGLRRDDHPNLHLQAAYQKYGEENFDFYPLLYCDPENVLLYEQMCIDVLKPEYNIAKYAGAPMRGRFFSKEAKQKLSEMRMGHTFSDEARKKISKSHMV